MSTNFRLGARAFLLTATLAVLTFMPASVVRPQAVSSRPVDQSDLSRRQQTAYRLYGLRAAAAISGSFVSTTGYGDVGGPATLRDLVDLSELVIVAETRDNVCRPLGDARSIVTLYSLSVERILKGSALPTSAPTLALLGGRVGFPDGSWAQLNTPGLARPRKYLRMALFLRRAPSAITAGNERFITGQAYVPVAGGLGLYDLSRSQTAFVQPLGFSKGMFARTLHKQRMDPDAFVEAVASLAK